MGFLKALGSFFRAIVGAGKVAAPIISIAFPEIAPLYISTLGLATAAEVAFGSASGTGPQKLEQLTASLIPQARAWADKNGIDWPDADIKKWASAVVDTVNLIPPPKPNPVPLTLSDAVE